MKYEKSFFDVVPSRIGTACEKWDGLHEREGSHVLPMWVADMDIRCAAEITDALTARAVHGIYGYTENPQRAVEAMLDFFRRRHGISISSDQQTMIPCVVSGLHTAVRVLTKPGERIIVQTPVYGPFFSAVEENERTVVRNPLVRDANGCYTMDFDGLEAICRNGAGLMLLCNPHNPTARLWTRDELTQLCKILHKYEIPLVSDEIHWDFAYDGKRTCSVLSLPQAQSVEAPVLGLVSASKTFNIAGLQQAALLTYNPGLLKACEAEMRRCGVVQGNVFGMLATELAYREGEAWLEGLLSYLHEARTILQQEVHSRLPKAVLSPVEATYLGWLDLRAYGFSTEELTRRTHRHGVAFTHGLFFDKEEGDGFLRINFACPHSQLRFAMERLQAALLSTED